MLQELLQTLFLVAFTLGLVLLGILWKRRVHRQANLICGAYVLVSLLPLWNGYFNNTDTLSVLFLPALNLVYPWMLGPLLFLYCRCIQGSAIPWTAIAKHCSWPLGVLLLTQLLPHLPFSKAAFFNIYLAVLYSQIFVYMFIAWQTNRAKTRDAEQRYSGSEAQVWQWLDLMLKGFALIFMLDLVMLTANLAGYLDQTSTSAIFVVAESLYVFLLIGYVFKQPHQFFDRFDTSIQVKYHNSGLNSKLAQELAHKLNTVVDREKLYLENELNLTHLAQRLKVPEGHISQVLSEQLGQNFYEFINRKRVEQAKALLSNGSAEFHSILDLAYRVGFNNKTSFNTAFKRFTQLTPSQYRKNAAN